MPNPALRLMPSMTGEGILPRYTPIPPVQHVPLADQWEKLTDDGNGFLLFSDTHCPYHDHEFMNSMMDEAVRRNIKRYVLIGDFMDANQFSKRGQHLGVQRTWQEDVNAAEAMLNSIHSWFDSGLILMGNHDRWAENHYRGLVEAEWYFSRLFNTGGKAQFSRYEQCELESGGKQFRLLHGANYSGANPLGVAQRYAAKFGQGVVMGHQHHAVDGYDASGKHRCVSMGCCADPRKLAYLHTSPRTNPAQTQSFCIIKNGHLIHHIGGV